MEEKRPDQSFFKSIKQKYNQLKLRVKYGKIDFNPGEIKINTPLHKVAESGDRELTRLLLKLSPDAEASANRVNNDGDTPLHVAIKKMWQLKHRNCRNNDNVALLLIESGASVNCVDANDDTPLHAVIKQMWQLKYWHCRCYENLACLLIRSGASVNCRDANADTPLHAAIKQTLPQQPIRYIVAQELIMSGASVNCVNAKGDTPLHLAIRFFVLQFEYVPFGTIYLLLGHMSDVNSTNNRGFTPLHEAVQAENVKMADWLIIESRNENFNDYEPYYTNTSFRKYKRRVPFRMQSVYDDAGNKFLNRFFYSVESEDTTFLVDLVRMLLEAGANVNLQTAEGWTPLHFAVQRGLTDVVDILLQKGASVTLTAQNLPARILLKAPIKVMVKNGLMFKVVNDGYVNLYSGNTVLHQAAESDITDIAKLILDKGADINAQNSRGKTALHIAADNAKYHMVEFLILNGANLSIKDNYGLVPLENIYTGPYELVTAATKNYYDGDDDDDEFDDESYLAYRRELLKYIVLWQYNQEYLFVKNIHDEEYTISNCMPLITNFTIQSLWDEYEDTVDKMKDCIFEGSNISLYTILRHIFNDQLLAVYLRKKSVIQSLHSIDRYCAMFPEYEKVIEILPHKLKSAEERSSFLNKLIMEYNKVLPLEIVLQICSYLNNSDLKKFVVALCEAS